MHEEHFSSMATCCLPLGNKSHGHPFTTGTNTIYDLVGERLSAEACAGLSLVAKLKCVSTATSGLDYFCLFTADGINESGPSTRQKSGLQAQHLHVRT